jgi:hypothetical protein
MSGRTSVVLEELREIGTIAAGATTQPSRHPRHQPRLGERVGADDAIVGVGEIEERRRRPIVVAPVVIEPLVRVVGDDPDSLAPAVLEQALRCACAPIVQPVGLFGELM